MERVNLRFDDCYFLVMIYQRLRERYLSVLASGYRAYRFAYLPDLVGVVVNLAKLFR
jgi:hypothetical protein